MKKKLLILMDTIKPMVDGVSIFLDNILPHLSERYEITIIAPDYGLCDYKDVKLIQFPIRKSIFVDYGFPKIDRKIVRKEVKNCDVVFNNESVFPISSSFFAIKYAKKYRKPFFTYVHSIDWELLVEAVYIPFFIKMMEKPLLKIYSKLFFSNCSGIVVPFKNIENIFKKNHINGRFEIIPVGISDIFKPGPSTFDSKDHVVIGYVGRVSIEKGLKLLLKTFLKLKAKYHNLFLLIVGDGPDKRIFDAQKDVKVTSFISQLEVADCLRAMDVFVLPSITETSSISTLEAMKSGLCCVTRNVGCIGDYLKHGFNGYFFDTDDELLDILEDLIKDEKLRKKIGMKGRKSVENYTWNNTANCLIEVFERYLNDSPHKSYK